MDGGMDQKMSEQVKRELSREEAEQVVGGAFSYNGDGTVTVDGKTMSRDQFHTKLVMTANRYGFETAVDTLKRTTGFTCPEMADYYDWGNLQNDKYKMETVMRRFWASYAN